MPRLKPGDLAPPFSLAADTGETFSLDALKGTRVVLYFYPKDMTSGCTTQALSYTELLEQFKESGAVVLGVSRDSLERHGRFREKHDLGFPLLSDPDHAVHEAYGAWGPGRGGQESAIRSTVIIGPDGRIEDARYNVKAKDDAACTLELVKER